MFRNLPPLCKFLIVALVASAVLSLMVPTVAVAALPLYSQLVIRAYQIWRLVTYPFFVVASMQGLIGAIFSLAWKAIIVSMFGGELETIVHTKRLTIALAITIVVGGVIFSFLSPDGVLAGPSIIIMFLLGAFAYLWPKREISVFGFFWVKAWVIALAVFILSVIPMSGTRMDASAENLFGPVFGALGAIVSFHVMYRQYAFGKTFLDRVEDMIKGKPPRRSAPVKGSAASDTKSVEARIDAILDKIASSGMQSLSKEEREFLLKNSG